MKSRKNMADMGSKTFNTIRMVEKELPHKKTAVRTAAMGNNCLISAVGFICDLVTFGNFSLINGWASNIRFSFFNQVQFASVPGLYTPIFYNFKRLVTRNNI